MKYFYHDRNGELHGPAELDFLACAVLLVLALSSLACLLPSWRMKHASVTDLLSVREG